MMLSKSFLFFGLWALQLVSCLAANDDVLLNVDFGPQALRQSRHLTVHQEDDHRSLQESSAPTMAPTFSNEFPLPFQVIWNMAFSNETAVRESTEEELTGLFYATLNWLVDSARAYYEYRSDVMILDRIDLTHYLAGYTATDDHPSTVGMECTCYFQANEEKYLPSVFQFLVAFSSGFNRTVFLDDYLSIADPPTSMYRNVTDLRYNILPSNVGTSGINIDTLNMNTEWKYDIGFGIPDREPSEEEYEGLLAATNEWLVNLLLDAYPPNSNGNPEFHMLETDLYSRSFDANQSPAHAIGLLTDVSFRVADASAPLGIERQDLLDLLETADLGMYRDNYLHSAKPLLSLFSGVLDVSWTPVDGNL